MYQSVHDAFIPFNEPLEAREHFMYLDQKSLVTTGIGNLLDADDPQHFGSNAHLLPYAYSLGWFDKNTNVQSGNAEIDQEYNTVKFSGTAGQPINVREQITTLRITDATIDTLVLSQLASFESTLKGRPEFQSLDAWPADAQLGLFSMAWAMGPMFNFPHFQAAAAQQNWIRAARECYIKDGAVARNGRNQLLFSIASWVSATVGDFTQLVYDVTLGLAENMRSGKFPIPLNSDIGLQAALEQLGYDPQGLDGAFGSGTLHALNTFEDRHGIGRTAPTAKSIADVPTASIDAIAAALDSAQIKYFYQP